jgi:hypothetical protein
VANLSLDRHGDTAPAPAPSPAVVTQAGSNEGKDGKDEAREPLAAKVLEKNGDDNMKRKCVGFPFFHPKIRSKKETDLHTAFSPLALPYQATDTNNNGSP